MQEDQPQFRITVWPSDLPPVNHVETLTPYRLDGGVLKLDLDNASFKTASIPDELYLREFVELDPDNGQAIVEFVNNYGLLSTPHRLFPLFGIENRATPSLPLDAWKATISAHPRIADFGPVERRDILNDGIADLARFGPWIQAFRLMTDIWKRYESNAATDSELTDLSIFLPALLKPFSPTVSVIRDNEVAHEEFDPYQGEAHRLENVLALQLFRHVAAGNNYHQCENTKCRRLFVHQRGRSRCGQNRSDSKFCSKNCAKAQTQRNYIKKKKESRD